MYDETNENLMISVYLRWYTKSEKKGLIEESLEGKREAVHKYERGVG